MTQFDVLIVGSGHGGVQAATALRQLGFAGSIAIVSAESDPPYERPPLSKEYLAGEKSFDDIVAWPSSFWRERQVELILGEHIEHIDASRRRVTSRSGRVYEYSKMVWAAGGRARALTCNGGNLAGVHSIRSRVDVDTLCAELAGANRVAVVGGGYIGLEAASVLTKLGKSVTVLEAMDRLLARVAGEPISRFFEAEHCARGVDVNLNVAVERLEGENGRVVGVRLADGTLTAAQIVIVGIGIVPNVEPLLRAGALGGNGVNVDEYCRTSLPAVWAVGDCALHRNRFASGHHVRIESVQNASDQAVTAARDITDNPQPYDATPWFWSNQYDIKLQTVGLSLGYDEAIVRGDPAGRRFSVIYRKDGAVIALDCVNMVKDYVQGRALVERRARVEANALADTDRPLKSLPREE